jgi:hypothetical protein
MVYLLPWMLFLSLIPEFPDIVWDEVCIVCRILKGVHGEQKNPLFLFGSGMKYKVAGYVSIFVLG